MTARRVPGNRRLNERPSPAVADRKLQTLQILAHLNRQRRKGPCPNLTKALADLGFIEDDLTECCEDLFQELIEDGMLTECGGCDHYHRRDFYGDCRQDDERFPGW